MQYYLKSPQRFMVRHAHGLQPVHYRMIQFFRPNETDRVFSPVIWLFVAILPLWLYQCRSHVATTGIGFALGNWRNLEKEWGISSGYRKTLIDQAHLMQYQTSDND